MQGERINRRVGVGVATKLPDPLRRRLSRMGRRARIAGRQPPATKEHDMTVAISLTLEGATERDYDQVHELIARNAPKGLVLHTMGTVDGQVKIFDVWKDAESFDRFARDTMQPAMAKVASDVRPQVQHYELHNVWQADARELTRVGADPMPSKAMA
jgi:hypothetical protein